MDMIESASGGRADLMAAVIEHLACYIQTGRPRSARLAMLVLDRLAVDADTDDPLREHCRQLSEVLEDRGEQPKSRSAPFGRLREAPRPPREYLGEAA
jgi:hypothetical protein